MNFQLTKGQKTAYIEGDKVYWQHWCTWEDNVVNIEYPTRCGCGDLIDEEDVEIIEKDAIMARKARGFVVQEVHEPTKVKTSIGRGMLSLTKNEQA